MDLKIITQQVFDNIDNLLKKNNLGITTGFSKIDESVGRLQAGQLWTISAYTGTGKSNFILNMVKSILYDNSSLKLCVFSTELSDFDYMIRLYCMNQGIYKIQLQKDPGLYGPKIQQEALDFYESFSDTNSLDIQGSIIKLEQIEEQLEKNKYDVIFIDYVQELTANGRYDVKDTMPIIAKRLKEMALKYKTCIVAVSQVNNYAMDKGKFNSENSQLMPISFGKELTHASHVVILLERKKVNDVLDEYLTVKIMKARDGQTGVIPLKIRPGYQLAPLSELELFDYKQKYDKPSI